MVKPRVTYHGLYHAVDVLHAVWIMLYGSYGDSVAKLLTPLSQFALMCGAVAHDLDHPGKCTFLKSHQCIYLQLCQYSCTLYSGV
jgi:3'5'-cyclic nucleotide phosphodiesterase